MTYATQLLKRMGTAGGSAALRPHGYKQAGIDKNTTRLINGDIRFAIY